MRVGLDWMYGNGKGRCDDNHQSDLLLCYFATLYIATITGR